jgi:microcompartment protein CcmL/EutN
LNRGEAIGLIEAIGLATAVEAADAAVKSANVRLIGYEPCKGDGMSTIKVAGANGRGVFSVKVIPRPAEGIEKLIYNSQTVGYVPAEEKTNDESVEEETTDSTEE